MFQIYVHEIGKLKTKLEKEVQLFWQLSLYEECVYGGWGETHTQKGRERTHTVCQRVLVLKREGHRSCTLGRLEKHFASQNKITP